MRKSAQQLKNEVPLLLDGIVGPNRDTTRDCYCIPFWWHGGCTGVFYDPAFEEIAQMYSDELNDIARNLLGYKSPTPIEKQGDEKELKLWALTFRTVLPTIASLEAHLSAKGFIYSYASARHLHPDERNRLLVLADQLIMCKMLGITWQEGLDNDYLSVHSVVSEGILSTEFHQFIMSVRELIDNPDGSFDEEKLGAVHDAARQVFHSFETSDKAAEKGGSSEGAVRFLKATTQQILEKLKSSLPEGVWEDLNRNLGKTFDDLLDDEDNS